MYPKPRGMFLSFSLGFCTFSSPVRVLRVGLPFLSVAVETWIQPLLFATGTRLYVDAKEPKISVLSLLFPSKETESDVCVATGGIQRDQEMTVRTTVDETKVKTSDGAMYSLGNANYFAAFGRNITTCELGAQQENRVKSEDSAGPPVTSKPSPPPCTEVDESTTHTTHTNDGPKVNFRTLTINSIRVLLAKAVAFDILVTVKAMFF